jgi:serine/threonine-protein kinase
MAARLSHPHIVPIYSVDEAEGVVYFAMGLVEGEPLAAMLAREPRPPLAMVRRVLREVADALHYAHQAGVVHRDIKPDNILIEAGTGRALVTDFGIARAAEGDQRLTVTGIAVGTPAYMSPEQAMGEREVDGRADIYALGIVAYQMLAGELPFQATNTPSMLMKHLSERPRPLAQVRGDLPANLVHAVERALEKGRNERWPDAEAFRVALAEDAAPEPPRRRSHPATVGAVPARLPEGDSLERLRRDTPLPAPPFPPLPRDWMFDPQTREHGKELLRRWREEQRRWREERGRARSVTPSLRQAAIELNQLQLDARHSPEARIARTRQKVAGGVVTIGMLATINLVTSPMFPWVVFPAIGIGYGIVRSLSNLWADGIPVRDVFRRPQRPAVSGNEQPLRRLEAKLPAPAASSVAEAVLDSVPRDVLAGTRGGAVRDAYEARAQIRGMLARLPETEKALLPEILPTVEALVERARTLAIALHSLDTEVSDEAMRRLRERLEATERMSDDAPERLRRIELLERQLATLTDLSERRGTLSQQLDHALLVLETMKLDLTRLRSSGVESRLAEGGSLTQEMRALARDVQRVSEAVEETRKDL